MEVFLFGLAIVKASGHDESTIAFLVVRSMMLHMRRNTISAAASTR
jgi:hypothetical protein